MKERPILFSGPMVRAILEGRKTQTRRILKARQIRDHAGEGLAKFCPYGGPGDLLWVRETWAAQRGFDCLSPLRLNLGYFWYRATDDGMDDTRGRWRPSIHMPRWASRITLEIKDVRVERLNEISDADAKAEGVILRGDPKATTMYDGIYRDGFRSLWESINGEDSWDLNPWVWVVEFEMVK